MQNQIVIILFSLILVSGSVAPAVLAQAPEGVSGASAPIARVDIDGSWYVGENLKVGEFFKYKLCHQSYKDCSDFWMSFWVEKETVVDGEKMWLFQVLVEDGNKVAKGYMNIGKVAPEPTGGSDNIISYGAVYKSSISWLSGFVTAEIDQPGKGPKDFRLPSWGKIANIGGEQVAPLGLATITVPSGEYDTVIIGWKSGGKTSHIWVVDEFPFPVKASTWEHVTEGAPPQEYRFELHEYRENVSTNPFTNYVDTAQIQAEAGCSTEYDLVKKVANTNTGSMFIKMFYGPEKPRIGCDMKFVIEFMKPYSSDLYETQVHYDILRVDMIDGQTVPTYSAANDEGRDNFWSAGGKVLRYWLLEGEPGLQTFAILIKGVGPEFIAPSTGFGFFTFEVDVQEAKSASKPTVVAESETSIPGWIKNNAEWWADGLIPDSGFVSGIQWLISNDIMKIPPTEQGTGYDNVIPGWIKNNAEWWADDMIPDSAFVSGLQWLISNGIMKLS